MLMVVLLVGVLAAVALPSGSTGTVDRLTGMANGLAAELSRVHSLAVTHNSSYRITFEPQLNRYYLEHVGPRAALNTLPETPFPSAANTASRQYTELARRAISGNVELVGCCSAGGVARTNLVFGPYGETSHADATHLWLTSGTGTTRRFIPLTVNPVTGLTTVGQVTSHRPPQQAIMIKLP